MGIALVFIKMSVLASANERIVVTEFFMFERESGLMFENLDCYKLKMDDEDLKLCTGGVMQSIFSARTKCSVRGNVIFFSIDSGPVDIIVLEDDVGPFSNSSHMLQKIINEIFFKHRASKIHICVLSFNAFCRAEGEVVLGGVGSEYARIYFGQNRDLFNSGGPGSKVNFKEINFFMAYLMEESRELKIDFCEAHHKKSFRPVCSTSKFSRLDRCGDWFYQSDFSFSWKGRPVEVFIDQATEVGRWLNPCTQYLIKIFSEQLKFKKIQLKVITNSVIESEINVASWRQLVSKISEISGKNPEVPFKMNHDGSDVFVTKFDDVDEEKCLLVIF